MNKYKILIIAYREKIDDERLKDFTEIHLISESVADALAEAKKIFIARNYLVRAIQRIEPDPFFEVNKEILKTGRELLKKDKKLTKNKKHAKTKQRKS